jgi:type I restriction enzyme M protein
MNMIMHGDGHGGVHHWNGFLNVNGIFEGRFDLILTNPPFGAHVEPSALVEMPEGKDWEEAKRRYAAEHGDLYRAAVARVEAAKGKPIASLFQLPRRGADEPAPAGPAQRVKRTRPAATETAPVKVGKIKTELLFIERCLDLLKPGGRLGIVLPEGVFNNPSLAFVREFVEARAFLRAVVSLPPETFFSSGASVKASILFLEKFTDPERTRFERLQAAARAEIEAKHAAAIASETKRLEAAVTEAKAGGRKDDLKARQRELADYSRAMAEQIDTESRALLRQRFDYPVFLYEAAHVGLTATGEPDANELYPNDRQPPGTEGHTCVELYRQFRKNPESFFASGPAA